MEKTIECKDENERMQIINEMLSSGLRLKEDRIINEVVGHTEAVLEEDEAGNIIVVKPPEAIVEKKSYLVFTDEPEEVTEQVLPVQETLKKILIDIIEIKKKVGMTV